VLESAGLTAAVSVTRGESLVVSNSSTGSLEFSLTGWGKAFSPMAGSRRIRLHPRIIAMKKPSATIAATSRQIRRRE